MRASMPQTNFEIVRSSIHHTPDVAAFIETLNALGDNPSPQARTLFDSDREIIVARAPGRLDVMGGIADYSGSLVLELPIAEATFVALQKVEERALSVLTLTDDSARDNYFAMSLADFERSDREAIEYEEARKYFAADAQRHWAAYVAGVFLVLMRERSVRFSGGARILVSSRVPLGKGVSSSAALEVATMSAVAAAFEIEIDARSLAQLCRRVESLV